MEFWKINIATRCNYRYKFELWKQNINDKNVEAQRFADFTADNLFDEKYQFLLANFPFEIGQKYCWRVTAYDPFEKATFLQNGKSEVRSFIYKHLPVSVTGLKHTINERNRQATVTWNAAEGHTKYYVEYYNPQTTKTIAMEKDEPKFTLASAPEKEYTILFRVKAQCWGDDSRCSNWSDWDTIKYAAPQIVEPKYPCGYQFPKVEITNFELKTDFKEGDIVSEANGSSDYEIINWKSDGNGVLQGQFYLIMNAWGGAKIACEFWDTKINTDNQIITTRYRSIDTPVGMVEPEELANYVKSLWLDGNSLATSSKIRDTIVIDQKFDYLYRRESGEFVAVVVNSDGSTTETEFDLHKNPSQTLITDGKGDSLVYSQNGQVMGIKEYRATGGNRALLNDYHRKSDSLAQWKINFLPYSEQIYAFDYLGSGNHGIFATDEYYSKSGNYDFRYKSIECGKTDKVIVDFGSYPEKDSVIFKDKYGVTLKLSKGNILNFTGVAKPDTNYIYAYRGDRKIGKLSVNTYKQKTYKVVLVSVNGAKMPDISSLQDSLNKFYKQCVVSFEVDTDTLNIKDLFPFSHGDKNCFSSYNDDQKRVLTAYSSRIKPDINYLFFILDGAETNGVAGYNPHGYNFGFIYYGAGNRTIAHELAHGIASLNHPFKDEVESKGRTENLLDYNDGVALWHFQWDKLQNPTNRIFKWNFEEEDAEGVERKDSISLIINDKIVLMFDYKTFVNDIKSNSNKIKSFEIFVVDNDMDEDYNYSLYNILINSSMALSYPIQLFESEDNYGEQITIRTMKKYKSKFYLSYNNKKIYEFILIKVYPSVLCRINNEIINLSNYKNIKTNINKMELMPVLLVNKEVGMNDVDDSTLIALINRTKKCSYLVDSFIIGDHFFQDIDWQSVFNSSIVDYNFSCVDQQTSGSITFENQKISFVRSLDDISESKGYYIEENYINTNPLVTSKIICNESCVSVKLLPVDERIYSYQEDILGETYKYYVYNIYSNGKLLNQIKIHKSFILSDLTNNKLLVKNLNEEVIGEIDIIKEKFELIEPKINLITFNGEKMDSWEDVIKSLNVYYKAMNVIWKKNKSHNIDVDFKEKPIKEVRALIKKMIIENYDPKEYYAVYMPQEMNDYYQRMGAGGFTLGFNTNFFFITHNNTGIDYFTISPHELGHCNGLNEFAIDYYNATPQDYQSRIETKNSTNMMGYRNQGQRFDFKISQIQKMITNIKLRISNK